MMLKDRQPNYGTQRHLCQWGCMTHGEYCRGSLGKVGLFIRDLKWKFELVYSQGVPRCYIVVLMGWS